MNRFAYSTTTELDALIYVLMHPFTIMWGGLLLHFIKAEIDAAQQQQRQASLRNALFGHGLRALFGVLSAILAYLMLMPTADELGTVSDTVLDMMRLFAFSLGYFCESIAETLAARAQNSGLPVAGRRNGGNDNGKS